MRSTQVALVHARAVNLCGSGSCESGSRVVCVRADRARVVCARAVLK